VTLKKHHKVVKDSGILLIGLIFTSIINYLFQAFMGRSLGPKDYGIMSTFFAFIYFIGIIVSTINTSTSNFTARFKKKNEYGKIKYKFIVLFKLLLKYGGIGFLIYLIFIPFLKNFTNIPDTYSFVLVGIVALVSLINALFSGLFNGLQAFFSQVTISAITTTVKLLSAVAFIYLGLNYISGILGVLFGGIAGAIFGYFIFKKKVPAVSKPFNIKDFFDYSYSILPSTIAYSVLFTVDIIILKSLFSAYDVGLYSAGSMIGKIILFASGVIVSLIFPKLSAEENLNKAKIILNISAFFLAIAGFCYVALLYFFPHIVIQIIYGTKYLPIASLLWLFGVMFLLYALNNLYRIYFYTRKKFFLANISIVFLILEIVGLYLFHSSLKEVLLFLVTLNFIYFIINLIVKK
jgi:O-antigen/teichoic acid export membrane protein